MSYRNVIVTGGNRGIGLEFVRQFLSLSPAPQNVIATTRKTSVELDKLKSTHPNLRVLILDVVKYADFDAFVGQVKQIVGNDGLDLLVNNAGVNIHDNLQTVTPKNVLTNVEVNAVAPLILTKTLLPLLHQSASTGHRTIIANISSAMGSIADNGIGSNYSYRASKVAMNMISKSLSIDLKSSGVIVLALHPGWVQTDMGTEQGLITATVSVSGLLRVIEQADISKSGSFTHYTGKDLLW